MQRNLVRFSLILILALTVVAPAIAQVDFRVSSLPRNSRGEGRTEVAGEVTLRAASAGFITAGSTIVALFDGRITNTPTAAGNLTCSFAAAIPSAAQCTGGPGFMNLSFSGRQLTVGFTANTTFAVNDLINFFGVRLDVAGLGTGITIVNVVMSGASANPGTNPITFTDAIRPVMNVLRPSITVAEPLAPLGAIGSGLIAPPGLLTCAPGLVSWAIQITETFSSAFTSLAQERGFSTTPAAAERLRLRVRLFGIPAGFTIAAISVATSSPSLCFRALPGATNQTTSGERRDFDITFADIDAGANNVCETAPGAGVAGDDVTGTPGNFGPRLNLVEAVVVTFTLSHTSGLAVASGGLTGPITAEVQLRVIEDPLDPPNQTIISFADNRQPDPRGTVANISDCLTTLLFPYLASNVGGFDSGISIANTSNDDAALGAVASATSTEGPCTLTGYKAADATTVTFTTPTVKAGTSYINLLSALATFGGATGGFQGYMFGVCRFLNAHAFAFIFDGVGLPAPRVAEGFLALVLPQPRPPVPCAGGICGEALGH